MCLRGLGLGGKGECEHKGVNDNPPYLDFGLPACHHYMNGTIPNNRQSHSETSGVRKAMTTVAKTRTEA